MTSPTRTTFPSTFTPDPSYVALALVPGIGRSRLDTLLEKFGTARRILGASSAELQEVHGIGPAAVTAIRDVTPAAGERILRRCAEREIVALAPDDPRFPEQLRRIPDAPALLFAKGRTELLGRACVAIVGTRSHSRYGTEVCRHLAGGAARAGLVVVSGMARGIDAIAHRAALDADGMTVGVLGNGIGVIYPSANRALYERVEREGCLLSEYPPGERPNAGSFQSRNRLISGLARATVVIEAGERSGALITARCASEQSRDVLAVPGPVTSPASLGCNRLIQMGAKPALGLRDILEEYGIGVPGVPSARLPTDLTEGERRMLDAIGSEERHVDELALALSIATAEALAVLTSLEIRGLIVQEPGKRFRKSGSRVP